MPEDIIEPLCCPQCGSQDRLATEELLQGCARAEFALINGELDVGHTGWTDVYWDSSETVGVCCNTCGWNNKSAEALITVTAYEQQVEKEEADVGHA